MSMTEPAQMTLLEQGVYARYLGSVEEFGVSVMTGPFDIQDAS